MLTDPLKSFRSFIEGESNQLARAMALSVSERPASSYNPLYIYGGRGLGKSHILNAIRIEGERNGYTSALTSLDKLDSKTGDWPDITLIDDAELSSKLEFDAIFAYISGGGQMVLTGSISPDDLPESPLSRLIREHGRSADIQPPEEELRVAILRSRAEEDGIALPDDVALFIARSISTNIKTLVGALKRVRDVSSLSGQKITMFSATQALREYL